MADHHPPPYEPYQGAVPPHGSPQPHPYAPPGQYGAPAPYGLVGAHPALPEGVTLAPVGRRVGAYFLALPLFLVTLGIGYLVWGLIAWGKGTSPALQVLGMRAWKESRQAPASWGDMAGRNIGDWVIAFVSCSISSVVSFVLFLSDEPRHRTLADRIGGTIIVHDPHKRLG